MTSTHTCAKKVLGLFLSSDYCFADKATESERKNILKALKACGCPLNELVHKDWTYYINKVQPGSHEVKPAKC